MPCVVGDGAVFPPKVESETLLIGYKSTVITTDGNVCYFCFKIVVDFVVSFGNKLKQYSPPFAVYRFDSKVQEWREPFYISLLYKCEIWLSISSSKCLGLK